MTVLREFEGIRYHLYQAADLGEVAAVQAEAFTSGTEPVFAALQTKFEQFEEFIQWLGPAIDRDGLTIVARDVSSGALVGSSIHLDMATENPAQVRQLEWLAPALALLDELDRIYLDKTCEGRHVRPGEFFHFCWGAVAQRFQGRHIVQTMVDLSLDLAVAKNYRTAVVEASSPASQHVFRKRGFTNRVEIVYKDYVYQGRHPFESATQTPSIILMDAPLTSKPV